MPYFFGHYLKTCKLKKRQKPGILSCQCMRPNSFGYEFLVHILLEYTVLFIFLNIIIKDLLLELTNFCKWGKHANVMYYETELIFSTRDISFFSLCLMILGQNSFRELDKIFNICFPSGANIQAYFVFTAVKLFYLYNAKSNW